jgi:hypothetical protein
MRFSYFKFFSVDSSKRLPEFFALGRGFAAAECFDMDDILFRTSFAAFTIV